MKLKCGSDICSSASTSSRELAGYQMSPPCAGVRSWRDRWPADNSSSTSHSSDSTVWKREKQISLHLVSLFMKCGHCHRSQVQVQIANLSLSEILPLPKQIGREKSHPTSCEHLCTFANTFVVVCILCAKIISWLAYAAYFAGRPCKSFKVNPANMQRKKKKEEEEKIT